MERIVQYVNDVTKDFDDHIPCRGRGMARGMSRRR
jgi:hypothetical protein